MPSSATTSRLRESAFWLVIVVGTFGALIALALTAFSSAPPLQVLASATTAAELENEPRQVRDSRIVALIPEDARDVRILWRPGTDEFAGAWHGSFDPAAHADCPVVQAPALPDYAERIVRTGTATVEAFECGGVAIARVADTTYAWSL